MRVRAGHDSGQGDVWDTRFYYDSGSSPYAYLFESDNDKTMTVAYTVDPYADLISQRRNSATYYHLYDQLGSTRKLLDSNQAVTDAYSYYVFGDVRTSSGSTTNPFNFVGRLGYYDDRSTDFQYLRARYYGPGYGRFWSADPAAPAQRAYDYVDNQAVVASDPSGLHGFRACYQPCVDVCVAQGGNWYWCGLRCEAVCAFHRHRPHRPRHNPPPGHGGNGSINPCACVDPNGNFSDTTANFCQDCAGHINDTIQGVFGGTVVGERARQCFTEVSRKCGDNPSRTPDWMREEWQHCMSPNWGDVGDIIGDILPGL